MKFKFEPQSTAEVVRLGIAMLIIFGILPWTPEQEVSVLAFVSIALTWVTRSFSIPTQEIVDAGGSVANVKAVAEDNRRAKEGVPPAIPPSAMVALLVAGSMLAGSVACAEKRYKPGTTVTQAMAYELDEGLKPLVATQQKVIATVDAACSPQATDKTECARLKPVADKFLTPVYELLKLVRDDVSPRLKQLEAAIQAVDAARQGSLRAELIPLLAQLNTLSGQAFGVSLPDSLVSRATTLAGKSITTFVQLRDAVKELIDKIRADTVGTTAPAPPVEAY